MMLSRKILSKTLWLVWKNSGEALWNGNLLLNGNMLLFAFYILECFADIGVAALCFEGGMGLSI